MIQSVQGLFHHHQQGFHLSAACQQKSGTLGDVVQAPIETIEQKINREVIHSQSLCLIGQHFLNIREQV